MVDPLSDPYQVATATPPRRPGTEGGLVDDASLVVGGLVVVVVVGLVIVVVDVSVVLVVVSTVVEGRPVVASAVAVGLEVGTVFAGAICSEPSDSSEPKAKPAATATTR